MSGNQANKISRYAYQARSTTGHQGSLLGSERFYGYEPMSMFNVTSSTTFDYSMLGEIQQLSRAVLVKALSNTVTAPPHEQPPVLRPG